MRRHNSMMSVLSGLLAVGLVVGLSVGSALAVEPTDNTGAGQSATQMLDSLEVKGRAPKTGHGPMWIATVAIRATTSSTVI